MMAQERHNGAVVLRRCRLAGIAPADPDVIEGVA